jgi:hypothetical protein
MQGYEAAEYFPELRSSELQQYAQRWARRYRGIERVRLYNYVPDHFAIHKGLYSVQDLSREIIAGVKESGRK